MRGVLSSVLLATAAFLTGCGGGTEPRTDGGGGMDAGDAPSDAGTFTGDGGPSTDGGGGLPPDLCPGAELRCGDACVDVSIDVAHCGACDAACGAGVACVAGACGGSASCPAGTLDCGGECRDVSGDPEYCGSCARRSCAREEICEDGACTCRPGLASCGGGCVDTRTDPAHCGACGAACDGVCLRGRCGTAAECTEQVCDGACVDTDYDPTHCGGCGTRCAVDQVCIRGSCEDYEPAPGCSACEGCDTCPSDAFCCEIRGYGPSCLDLGTECPPPPPSV